LIYRRRKMKKLVILLTGIIFLAVPLAASAYYLGYGDMSVTYSNTHPGVAWYTEYRGTATGTNFSYDIVDEGIFCVSKDSLKTPATYDFYTIDETLLGQYAGLGNAAYIADHYVSWGIDQEMAQLAIWTYRGMISIDLSGTAAQTAYDNAAGYSNYTTENWYFALAPSQQTPDVNSQEYLTPAPEPMTILLLGFGLLGVGLARRKS
jgi:hypothetical protein